MSTNSRLPNSAGDDLDRLLTSYFQAEMPKKWPPAPHGSIERPAPASADPARRSRWALAASVALLVGCFWFLTGKVTDGQPRPHTNFEGTADAKHVKDLARDKAP